MDHGGSRQRVLVVEDDPAIRHLHASALKPLDADVAFADDGRAAKDAVLRPPFFDVVLLDLVLPGDVQGLEILRAIATHGLATQVIVVSGHLGETARREAVAAGAVELLDKPFDVVELQMRVDLALEGARAAERAKVRRVGDIVIESGQLCVSRDGAVVPLTPLEFRLLWRLTDEAGAVVPAETLCAYIWLDAHKHRRPPLAMVVSRLRRKLDRPDASSHIEAAAGVGYRFVVPSSPPGDASGYPLPSGIG